MAVDLYYESFARLETFMELGFIAAGVPSTDAKICASVLIESDKRGIDSHGVGRFKPIYIDRLAAGIQQPVTKIETIRETATTAVLDGGDGMGQVIGVRAMELALEKARTQGMGMVAVRNSTHYGIAGYYALMAAKNNMLGITGTNARPSIAPTFGVENMLGTNPLTIGFPTDEDFPFILDCATSITQRGKIEHYARMGKALPHGWVINAQGQAVTDPDEALLGLIKGTCALTPLGGIGEELAGYKGYGYATVVEVLSAALQGGAFLHQLSGMNAAGEAVPYHLGHFFLAVDIAAFTEPEQFKQTAGEIMRELRASKKAGTAKRIYTAGEKEYLAYQERKQAGVPLNQSVRDSLIAVRDTYQIDFTFAWEHN